MNSKHIRDSENNRRRLRKSDPTLIQLPQFSETTNGFDNTHNFVRMAREKNERHKELQRKQKDKFEELRKEFAFIEDQDALKTKKQKKDELRNPDLIKYTRQDGPIEPYIFLMKMLARKEEEFGRYSITYKIKIIVANNKAGKSLIPRLKAWIPDTIVWNDTDQPFWIYSNEKGEVWRTDEFAGKEVITKLCNFSSSNELVAVMKRGSADSNEVKLLTAKELGYEVQSLTTSGSKGNAPIMIQRYVKSIGSKAFIVRTAWFKNHPPYSFVVSSTVNFYDFDGAKSMFKYKTHPEKYGYCHIEKTNKGKNLTDTLRYVKNIVKYFKGALGTDLRTVVADFIKDESGIWWLISIKRIITEQKVPKNRMIRIYKGNDNFGDTCQEYDLINKDRGIDYQKSKVCKYCEKSYSVVELTKKMTLKMIIQMDKHLKIRGWSFDWLNRAEFQYLDISNLYEVHQVCKVCYRLYEEVTKLVELYEEFSKGIGIHMSMEKADQLVSITTLKKPPQELLDVQTANNELEKKLIAGMADGLKGKADDISYNIEEHINRRLRPKTLRRFRLFIFIQKIENIPLQLDRKRNYSLEIHVLNSIVQVKLDMGKLIRHTRKDYDGYKLHLNRLTTKYFFSEGRQSLIDYIEKEKNMKMYILRDGKRVGESEFSLNDFVTDQVPTREFFQNFTGKEIEDKDFYWTWEMKCNIGFHGTEEDVSTEGLQLITHKGLWVCNDHYFTFEPLPKTWDKILNAVAGPPARSDYSRAEISSEALNISKSRIKSKQRANNTNPKNAQLIPNESEMIENEKNDEDDDMNATMIQSFSDDEFLMDALKEYDEKLTKNLKI